MARNRHGPRAAEAAPAAAPPRAERHWLRLDNEALWTRLR
jgi:hypothetical protein